MALFPGTVFLFTKPGCGQCVTVCPNGSISVQGRRFELGQVVELPPPEARATPPQLDALLLSRRSIRRFQDREVDREVVDHALVALQRLDDDRQIPTLFEIGLAAGAQQVKAEHFSAAFDGV